jgi:hypothetical protein
MTFDAGSIEAKLKLDRSEFQHELDAAKAEGEDFEGKDYTAKLKVDGAAEAETEIAGVDATYALLRENLNRGAKIQVDADTAKADAELEVTTSLVDRLNRKRVNIGSMFGGGALSAVTALGGAFGKMGENISEGSVVATPLFSAIIGLAPLAVAALVPLLGIAGALTSAFTGAIASIGAVGIIAMPLITKMIGDYQKLTLAQQQYKAATTGTQRAAALQAEAKATENLTGSEKGLFGMLQQVMGLYHRLQSEFAKPLASALTPWFSVAKSLIGLLPLIIGPALGSIKTLGQVVSSIVKSPEFHQFITMLGTFGAFALKQFGLAGIALAHAFVEIVIAFMPLARVILPGIVQLARAFAQWAEGLSSSSGFHQFIQYVIANGPLLGSLLISLLTIFVKLMIGLAPLGHVMLIVVTAIAKLMSVLSPNELLAVIVVVTLLGVILAATFAGVPLLIAAVVAGVVALFALLINFWPQIHRAWSAAVGVIERNVVNPLVSFFTDKLPHAFGNFINFWKAGWRDIQDWAKAAWTFLTHGWGQYIVLPLYGIRKAVEFLRGGWRTGWNDIKNIALDVWNFLRDKVFSPLAHVVTVTVPNAFRTGVQAVKTAWQVLGDVVKAPVRWVIGNVVNGLIRAFDWVSDKVGGPHIRPYAIGFQRGGAVGGYGGGDILPALLEPGETIVSKEDSRKPEMRAAFEEAGVPGYQTGGRVGNPPSHPAGFLGGIGHFFGEVISKVADVARATAAIATGNKTALTNAMADMIPGGTGGGKAMLAQLLTSLPAQLLKNAVTTLLGLGGMGGQGGDIVKYAMSFIGKIPYVWGGTTLGPGGADCSGFTGSVYRHFGISAPRTSEAQGAWVKRTGPQSGGLAFYHSPGGGPDPGHVAIVKDARTAISQGGGMGPILMGLHAMPLLWTGVPPNGLPSGGLGRSGAYSVAGMAALWRSIGGAANLAHLMGAIGKAESGGDPRAHNPSGASGLWQILGLPFPGDPFNPTTNARMARSKYLSQGLGAWEAYTNGSYRQFMDGGGWLPPGTTIVNNSTGGFERVVGPQDEAGGQLSTSMIQRLDRLIRAVEQNAITTAAGVADAFNGASRGAAYRAAYSTRGV